MWTGSTTAQSPIASHLVVAADDEVANTQNRLPAATPKDVTHWHSNTLSTAGRPASQHHPTLHGTRPRHSRHPFGRMGYTTVDTKDIILGGSEKQSEMPVDLSKGLAHIRIPLPMGHASIHYNNWLLSCFDAHQNGCTVFDTVTLTHTFHPIAAPPRTLTSLTLLSSRRQALLYAGQTRTDDLLNDLWQLDLSAMPERITASLLGHAGPPRAGHSAHLLDTSTLLLTGGFTRDDDASSPADLVLKLDSSLPWHTLAHQGGHDDRPKRLEPRAESPSTTTAVSQEAPQETSTSSRLPGGAIAGIVVGVFGLVACVLVGLMWIRRSNRRRLQFHNKSRAARFSLSSPSQSRTVSGVSSRSTTAAMDALHRDTLHPSRALHSASMPRLSTYINDLAPSPNPTTPSTSSEFHIKLPICANSLTTLPSTQVKLDSLIRRPEATVTKDTITTTTTEQQQKRESSVQDEWAVAAAAAVAAAGDQVAASSHTTADTDRRDTAFRRLTQNLSSAWRSSTVVMPIDHEDTSRQSPTEKTKQRRRSSLFGFRASRFLQLHGTSEEAESSNTQKPRMSVASSIGAKSVASVQWVGFNDTMDYKQQHWDHTVRLAVTNDQYRHSFSSSRHTSMYNTDIEDEERSIVPGLPFNQSSGSLHSSRPCSPTYSSSAQYRLSKQEALSWDDGFAQRLKSGNTLSMLSQTPLAEHKES